MRIRLIFRIERTAAVIVTFDRYLLYPGEANRTLTQETETIEIHTQELEPFLLALARALQLAKARGFLPATPSGAAT